MNDHRHPVRMPERLLCRAHLYRLVPEHHPSGLLWQTRYTILGTELFKEVVEDPRIHKLTGGQPHMLSAILSQNTPLCCFLPAAALDRVQVALDQVVERTAQRLGHPDDPPAE